MPPARDPCPCGRTDAKSRPLEYAACCGRFIDGGQPAPDAQALMRSRYTAFVRERADYLLATWHPSRRPAVMTFETGLRWLGLEVRSHSQTGPDTAEVEFVARSRMAGRAGRLHERSRFVREDGRWYYLDGDML